MRGGNLTIPFPPRSAAVLACSCRDFRQSHAESWWPAFDPAVASEEEITIVIQINGKVRSRISVPADEEGEKIKALALADERIAGLTAGKRVVKVVYVPKKLVNIVVPG